MSVIINVLCVLGCDACLQLFDVIFSIILVLQIIYTVYIYFKVFVRVYIVLLQKTYYFTDSPSALASSIL